MCNYLMFNPRNSYNLYSIKFFISLCNSDCLVPGDGGSQMEAKLDKPSVVHIWCTRRTNDWYSLWLNLELLTPYVLDCFIDNIR